MMRICGLLKNTIKLDAAGWPLSVKDDGRTEKENRVTAINPGGVFSGRYGSIGDVS